MTDLFFGESGVRMFSPTENGIALIKRPLSVRSSIQSLVRFTGEARVRRRNVIGFGRNAAPKKETAAQLKAPTDSTSVNRPYLGGSILSSTRFAVISANMMLLEIPNKA